ncbi:LysM domain-containing protein [Lysobacter sp. LF1]|uniref:LysM domain-containing protein n=1 Tax=Lysobacter stagni TaxID=3045172 RepID=A0ABT6XDZ1_9GAMM|nr:LysM domain-containing protein [Lysobacter sp. LF1]MDI9238365.1 LysM domain-containing protein [Lysobacter sp. LF1]
MFKPLRTVMAAALLTIATYGVAAEVAGGHPDTYVVKKGDTLWDIAGRFLQKPWLWPEIWQANPQVKNPHLIFPGDVLSLAYLDRVAVQEGPRQEAPINTIPLSDVESFLKDLRVVDQFEDLPYVVGLEEDRLRSSLDQVAYVKGLADAQPGQRYAVVRPTQRYVSPDPDRCCGNSNRRGETLNFRGDRDWGTESLWAYQIPAGGGEFLGYELRKMTTGTISRGIVGDAEAATLVIDGVGDEVRVGDRLIPVEAQPYDLNFMPHAPAQEIAVEKARVIAVADMITTGGTRDVIALSVGSADGVDNGTVFSTWREGSIEVDRVAHGTNRSPDAYGRGSKVKMPDEFAGHAMVFRTFDKVSYALVMDGVRPTRLGYRLKHPDATN